MRLQYLTHPVYRRFSGATLCPQFLKDTQCVTE